MIIDDIVVNYTPIMDNLTMRWTNGDEVSTNLARPPRAHPQAEAEHRDDQTRCGYQREMLNARRAAIHADYHRRNVYYRTYDHLVRMTI
jgi:Ser/Thr protein kinase RdoA (MazF antagonist)